MILNQNQQSDAQLIGDIQNNKVGIDTNNIDFITSLLTTNLYSQPIQSFIRETVANGWDSHVEAGTTDKPVILRIYTDTRGYIHIAVRDYGTGLSPERFNEIYLNIGASTKRTSNQYIGMFGLGRFSALAVSNTVHLTNYYQGVYSKYIMYKDAGKICIDKLFESATTEENGLEIEVNTEKPLDNYELRKKIILGIKQLTFYNNVYIDDALGLISTDGNPSADDFNARKIAEFNTFKVCNCGSIKNSLLMGNVLYPIDEFIINTWFKGIDSLPFAIKCNIGDVDITPSRETLLYSQKTIDTINKRCQETLEEIKEICKNNFSSDFKSITDYDEFVSSGCAVIDIKEFENKAVTLQIPVSELSYYNLSDNVTINGKIPPKNLIDFWHKILWSNFPSNLVLYKYDNGKFYVKDNRPSVRSFINLFNSNCVYIVNEPLKPIAKKYWSQNHNTWKTYYFLYKKHVYSVFRKIVKEFCNLYKVNPTDETLKFILEDFKRNYTNIPSFNNTDVPQEFIESDKAAKKNNRVTAQQKARKCVIYKLVEGRSYGTVSYDSNEYDYNKLKIFKGTVFFAEKDNAYLEALYYFYTRANHFNWRNVIFVAVAPTNLQYLRELDNTIEFNSVFTTKNKAVSKLCTYIYLVEKWRITDQNLYFDNDDKIGEYRKLGQLIYRLQQISFYLERYEGNNDLLSELLKTLCTTYYKKGWLNYELINLIESNISYIKLNNVFGRQSDFKDIIFAFHEYVTKNNITKQERFNRIKKTLKPILDEYTPNSELPHFNIG